MAARLPAKVKVRVQIPFGPTQRKACAGIRLAIPFVLSLQCFRPLRGDIAPRAAKRAALFLLLTLHLGIPNNLEATMITRMRVLMFLYLLSAVALAYTVMTRWPVL